MTAWILLAVGIVLIALTAIYVAGEFSLVTVDRATVDKAAADGDPGAKSLQGGLRNLSTQLSGAQIGITVTTLALGYVMEPSLARLLEPILHGTGLSDAAATSVAVAVALIVATVLSMVFGELVPKNLAIADPLATARRVVRPLRVTTFLSKPLIAVLNGTANGILRLVGVQPQEELRSTRSAQELWSLVRRSGSRGTLEARTARLVAQSIAFSGKNVADVLTPRVDVVFVKGADPASAVVAAAVDSGLSRFPVIGRDSDDVLGLVHLKRVVAIAPEDRDQVQVSALMTPAPTVPGTLPLDDALELLRGRGLQMAIVADEYGGTAGVVTLEDLVEELVGEIVDEHDATISLARRLNDGTWLVPGTMRPDEIAERSQVELPEAGEYDTVAGLLMDRLDRLADVGDSVVVPAVIRAGAPLGALAGDDAIEEAPDSDLPRAASVRITVRAVDGRRVREVVLSAAGLDDEEAGR